MCLRCGHIPSKLGKAATVAKAAARPCPTALKSRGPKPGQARARPFPLALARPEDLKSRSPLRPSQSRGFQAKPGRNSPTPSRSRLVEQDSDSSFICASEGSSLWVSTWLTARECGSKEYPQSVRQGGGVVEIIDHVEGNLSIYHSAIEQVPGCLATPNSQLPTRPNRTAPAQTLKLKLKLRAHGARTFYLCIDDVTPSRDLRCSCWLPSASAYTPPTTLSRERQILEHDVFDCTAHRTAKRPKTHVKSTRRPHAETSKTGRKSQEVTKSLCKINFSMNINE